MLISSYANMNDSNKRAEKTYGRWENHCRKWLLVAVFLFI